jgi:emfourin
MRVTFHMEGGIAHLPGLATPVVLTDADFTPNEQQAVRHLFDEPRQAATRARDAQRYVVSMEQDGATETRVFEDPLATPQIGATLNMLKAKLIEARRRK